MVPSLSSFALSALRLRKSGLGYIFTLTPRALTLQLSCSASFDSVVVPPRVPLVRVYPKTVTFKRSLPLPCAPDYYLEIPPCNPLAVGPLTRPAFLN